MEDGCAGKWWRVATADQGSNKGGGQDGKKMAGLRCFRNGAERTAANGWHVGGLNEEHNQGPHLRLRPEWGAL